MIKNCKQSIYYHLYLKIHNYNKNQNILLSEHQVSMQETLPAFPDDALGDICELCPKGVEKEMIKTLAITQVSFSISSFLGWDRKEDKSYNS